MPDGGTGNGGTVLWRSRFKSIPCCSAVIRGNWWFIRRIRVPKSSNEIRRGQLEQFETRIGRINLTLPRMKRRRDL